MEAQSILYIVIYGILLVSLAMCHDGMESRREKRMKKEKA
jgi:hypothetical protein